VTGEVRLHLAPGQCFVAGRRAPRALYDYELATYEAADRFRHEDAAGFVRLWGLSVETVARRQGGTSVTQPGDPGGTDGPAERDGTEPSGRPLWHGRFAEGPSELCSRSP